MTADWPYIFLVTRLHPDSFPRAQATRPAATSQGESRNRPRPSHASRPPLRRRHHGRRGPLQPQPHPTTPRRRCKARASHDQIRQRRHRGLLRLVGRLGKTGEDCLAVVSELVSAGCRVEGQALYRPIDRGELSLVRFLIEHGADVNVTAPKEYYTGVPKGCTPLGVAIQYGRTEIVAELIRAGADVNQRSRSKVRPRSQAPRPRRSSRRPACNQPQIIRILVAAGANPSVCDAGDYYGTPLMNGHRLRPRRRCQGADRGRCRHQSGGGPRRLAAAGLRERQEAPPHRQDPAKTPRRRSPRNMARKSLAKPPSAAT